jgi:hypothetical protein
MLYEVFFGIKIYINITFKLKMLFACRADRIATVLPPLMPWLFSGHKHNNFFVDNMALILRSRG